MIIEWMTSGKKKKQNEKNSQTKKWKNKVDNSNDNRKRSQREKKRAIENNHIIINGYFAWWSHSHRISNEWTIIIIGLTTTIIVVETMFLFHFLGWFFSVWKIIIPNKSIPENEFGFFSSSNQFLYGIFCFLNTIRFIIKIIIIGRLVSE